MDKMKKINQTSIDENEHPTEYRNYSGCKIGPDINKLCKCIGKGLGLYSIKFKTLTRNLQKI